MLAYNLLTQTKKIAKRRIQPRGPEARGQTRMDELITRVQDFPRTSQSPLLGFPISAVVGRYCLFVACLFVVRSFVACDRSCDIADDSLHGSQKVFIQ